MKKHKDFQDTNVYRQNFYLWMFISQEGLWEEAREFVLENMDTPASFEHAIMLKNTSMQKSM